MYNWKKKENRHSPKYECPIWWDEKMCDTEVRRVFRPKNSLSWSWLRLEKFSRHMTRFNRDQNLINIFPKLYGESEHIAWALSQPNSARNRFAEISRRTLASNLPQPGLVTNCIDGQKLWSSLTLPLFKKEPSEKLNKTKLWQLT